MKQLRTLAVIHITCGLVPRIYSRVNYPIAKIQELNETYFLIKKRSQNATLKQRESILLYFRPNSRKVN